MSRSHGRHPLGPMHAAGARSEPDDRVFLPHAEEGSLRGCDFGTQVSRRMRPGRRRGPNLVPFMNRSA